MKETKKIRLYISFLVLTLFLCSFASAIRVTLDTPQVVFTNATVEDVVTYRISVINNNDFPIDINITPPEGITINFLGPKSFELLTGESKDIPYEITLSESGNYSKSIKIDFSGNNESFSLYQNMIFEVSEKNYNYWFFMIVVISVIIIIVAYFLIKSLK